MEKGLNSIKGIASHVSLSPEVSWVRRHRAVLAALLLAGGAGLVASGYIGNDQKQHESYSEISETGKGFERPMPLKSKEPEAKIWMALLKKAQSRTDSAPVEKAVSRKPETNRVLAAQIANKPERWSGLESKQRMSATLFVSLTQGEEPYDIQGEAKKCGFNGVEGFPELLDSFDRLTDALAGSDSAEIQKSAQDYLKNYNQLGEVLKKPEVREALVKAIHSMPADFDEKTFMTTIKMGGIYAYCLAEGKCTAEAIDEAETIRKGQ